MTSPPENEPGQDPEITQESSRTSGDIPVEKPAPPSGGTHHRIAPKKPIHPLHKILILFFVVTACYTIFGFYILPQLITNLVPGFLEQKVNRAVTIGSAHVNPFRFSLILKNGIVGAEKNNPEDKVDPLFSFGRLEIKIRPQNIFSDQPILRAIHGNSVFLHIVRNKDLTLNLQKTFATATDNGSLNTKAFASKMRQIDIKLSDARLIFDDRVSATSHTIDQIRLHLPQKSKSNEPPYFSASVDGSPMEFGNFIGQSTAEKQTFILNLKKVNLPSYLNYLPPPFPTLLSKGTADIDLTITTTNTDDGFNFGITGTSVAHDIWLNDGKENHNKIDTATFAFSYTPLKEDFVFHKLILEKPELHLNRDKDGHFFFPAKATFNSSHPTHKLRIETVVVKNGRVVFIDQNIDGGFATSFNDINLSIDLNPSGEDSSYALNCITSRQTRLVSQGVIDHKSWVLEGLLIVNDLPLSAINPYLSTQQGLSISSGILTKLETSFILAPADTTRIIRLSDTSTSIKNLSLNFKGKEILNIPETEINKAGYSRDEHALTLGDIKIKQGRLHLNPTLLRTGGTASKPTLNWNLNSLSMTNSMVYLRDYPFQDKPQTIVIPNLQIADLSSVTGEKGTILGSLSLLRTATVQAKGTIQFKPFQLNLNTTLANLSLVDIPSPLLNWLKPPLLAGELSGQGTVTVCPPSFNGDLTIKDLKLRYGKLHDLLTVKKVNMGHGLYTPHAIRIDDITIKQMHTGMSISKGNIFNPDDFFNAPENTSPFRPTINTVQFQNSTLSLYDRGTTPPFSYAITNIDGSFSDIDPKGIKESTIVFTGQGSQGSTFDLQGNSTFFTKHRSTTVTLSLLDLPVKTFKPFIEPIIEYGLQDGLFSLKINYQEQDNIMHGETDLDISNLVLGKEEGGNTYFPNIVALLTNTDHRIKIKIPLNGTTTDPSYTFQSAYAKKLREYFLALTVSPYSAVSEYYTETPPNQIIFTPGTSDLAPNQEEVLETLQTILKDRPLLHITIAGFSGSGEDRATLLQQKKALKDKQAKAQAIATGDLVAKAYGTEGASRSIQIPSQVLPPKKIRLTKQELQALAIKRSEKIKDILMREYKINGAKLHIDATPTIVPESETGVQGHRVDLIPSAQP